MAIFRPFFLRPAKFQFISIHFLSVNNLGKQFSSAGMQEFDLVVIGGGSGGLSCAKEASVLGAKVAVLDYVTPSPRGSTWGLGGTCVNVGCIPKKLMHHAAILGESVHMAKTYGWELPELTKMELNWDKLTGKIQDHIKSVNWTTRILLRDKGIAYINGLARLVNENTIEATLKDGEKRNIKAKNILIAVGGRPRYPKIPGAVEYCITSDDIFNGPSPGKTLIVGAGYIGLECAGFLNSFGFDVTVLARSVILRGFDRQMVGLVTENMASKGVKFFLNTEPIEIKKVKENNRLSVTYRNKETKEVIVEEFDTVLLAIGRKCLTETLGVKELGIEVEPESGKIKGVNEQTKVSNIYVVGDVYYGVPELTPSAICAGKWLAHRLFARSRKQMDYENIATTIFSPLEYGLCGLSEEIALERYGADNIEVYHAFYKPIEFFIPGQSVDQCYLKVVTERASPQKILGLHFIGPGAGEVIQGYAAAMRCGITMEQLSDTVGIHPTVSEEFTRLYITKRSGQDPVPQTCCM